MAYTQLLYHIVFRTKNSRMTISEPNERLMYKYIFETSQNIGCTIHRIGGMPDHIHILVSLPPTLAVAQYVETVKTSLSKCFGHSPEFPAFEGWASGYAAITYSTREKDMIVNYIKGQKAHHKTRSFADEYRLILQQAGIAIDECYFLKNE